MVAQAATSYRSLTHTAVSLYFGASVDASAFDSPMRYPPCACGRRACPEYKPVLAKDQSESYSLTELRRRVQVENTRDRLNRRV